MAGAAEDNETRASDLERRLRAVTEALDRATRWQTDAKELLERERAQREDADHVSHARAAILSSLTLELRPPLGIAKSWSELVRRQPMSMAAREAALRLVERNIGAAMEILDEVVPLWQPLPVEPRWLPMEPMVRQALSELAARRTRVEIGAITGRAFCDRAQLERVIARTFSVAAELAPVGSTLSIASSSGFLCLSFAPTEQGSAKIPSEWSELGEAAPGSLSFRLFSLQKVARMIGGDVDLEGAPPSMLRLRLPVRPALTEPPPKRESLAGVRVRLVDADADWRHLATHLLERRGASVDEDVDDPHVVIHGLDFGDTASGVDPTSTFSIALLPHTARAREVSAALALGYATCLKKPFATSELVRAVEEGVRSLRGRAPLEPIRQALAALVPLAAEGYALDQILEDGERRRLAAFHVDAATQRTLESAPADLDAICRSRVTIRSIDGFCGELLTFRSEPLWALEEALVGATAERIGDLLDKAALIAERAAAAPALNHELPQPIQALVVGLELVLTRVRQSADEIPRTWLLDHLQALAVAVERLAALATPTSPAAPGEQRPRPPAASEP